MLRFPTLFTHKKHAILAFARMAVRKISVRALDPHRNALGHKQIKDPVNAVRRNPFATLLGKLVSDIVSRDGAVLLGKLNKNRFAHRRPLFAGRSQSCARGSYRRLIGHVLSDSSLSFRLVTDRLLHAACIRCEGVVYQRREHGRALSRAQAPSRRNSSRKSLGNISLSASTLGLSYRRMYPL